MFETVEVIAYDVLFELQYVTSGRGEVFRVCHLSLYLYQQTFLQVACSDAGRFELLQGLYSCFYFASGGIGVELKQQVVGYAVDTAVDEAVFIERAYQNLYDVAFGGAYVEVVYLAVKIVEKRSCVAYRTFFFRAACGV